MNNAQHMDNWGFRKIPYPYRAMLAICSDLDETPDRVIYVETAKFINTNQNTIFGKGVGLEVGNTIYFDMPPDQFAYWNTDNIGREYIHALIHSGHIDALHSYGDLADTREDARRALEQMVEYGCRFEVWIDHARAPTNLGKDIMEGHGDDPEHEAYHFDLTYAHGVRFVWRGRITSFPVYTHLGLQRIFYLKHPVKSFRTMTKEMAKVALSRLGYDKYRMHSLNSILWPLVLRDGTKVYEFIRSNPHWGGVDSATDAKGIGQILTETMLRYLTEKQGITILYTHLGKIRATKRIFDSSTVQAFERLASAQKSGDIQVTTTRRLLGYCRTSREANIRYSTTEIGCRIDIEIEADSELSLNDVGLSDIAGLTFYVMDPERTTVYVNGREIKNIKRNGKDHTGRSSVSIPWNSLSFPNL